MAQIVQMDGTVEESISFMQQELSETGEHHQPEVIGEIMAQLSMKAAEKEFGVERRIRHAGSKSSNYTCGISLFPNTGTI